MFVPSEINHDTYSHTSMNLDESCLEEGYSETQIVNTKLTVLETLNSLDYDLTSLLKEHSTFMLYKDSQFDMKASLKDSLTYIESQYPFLDMTSKELIIKVSDYNKIAKLYGNEQYTLDDDQYMVIANFESSVKVRNIALSNAQEVNIFGYVLQPKYSECKDGFVEISANYMNDGLFVVPDYVVENQLPSYDSIAGNFKATSKEEILQVEEEIESLVHHKNANQFVIPTVNTRLEIAEDSTGLGGMITFIGLYLGLVFLITCTALLALKELSESTDNVERYSMIRKLGADESMINKALFKQVGLFFAFPLILAIIHSVCGIKFAVFLLGTFGTEELIKSIVFTAGMIVIIYGGYFLITYYTSKNIIRSK